MKRLWIAWVGLTAILSAPVGHACKRSLSSGTPDEEGHGNLYGDGTGRRDESADRVRDEFNDSARHGNTDPDGRRTEFGDRGQNSSLVTDSRAFNSGF